MFTRKPIGVGNLLLNTSNYRIVPQDSQKGARDAIIAEQGRKLIVLAKDILDNGLSPFDLPMVIDAEDGNGNYVVMEGNRRLTAIQLMLDPELSKHTDVHGAFAKLHREHLDAVPRVIDCTIAPTRAEALLWGNRKHASGLGGAGTEPWTTMAKARADQDQGVPNPALDAVNFVLTDPKLDAQLRHHLEGSQFNLTTLERLVTTNELQNAARLKVINGKLQATTDKDWVQGVLTDVVTIIATGKKKGLKWTERDIDSQLKREDFVRELMEARPDPKKAGAWQVSGAPKPIAGASKSSKTKGTPSTEDQPNLIPRSFKLSLPAGKINDIFIELKKLDVETFRHSVSVLFRVFFELTLDDYIRKHGIVLPQTKDGRVIDKLNVRLGHVLKQVKAAKLLTDKELKPIEVAQSNKDSLLAPETLNAYVHSKWMDPDPMTLKITWSNVQLFIERLWNSKP
jgi:hypothetical protein